MADHTIALSISYDGAPFAGFARQPGLETVQGRLESALATVLRREVVTTGAGRTDAGVHARGQVVSFAADGSEPEADMFLRSLNGLAGPSIAVTEVRRAPTGFSARFDAIAREYRYRIVAGPVPPVFLRPYAWWVRPELDVTAMVQGATALTGEHDFKSFCVAESAAGRSTVRALEPVIITSEHILGEDALVLCVRGNAFLHSMVRVIAGTLVDVGCGRRPPEWVGEVLAARDRSAAGQTAPPHGLTLWDVRYDERCWLGF